MAISAIENLDQPVLPYKYIMLVFIFSKYLYEQVLNLRQLQKYMKKRMPKYIHKLALFTNKEWEHSQAYSFDRLTFQMYVLSLNTAIDCIQMVTFVWPQIWEGVPIIFPFIDRNSEFQRGVLFMCLESLKKLMIDIPISLYQTFVLEERYGQNQKTLKLYFSDLIMEAFLVTIIFVAVLYGYLSVIDNGGDFFLFYVELFIIVVAFGLQIIYSNFIAPLFNKFEEIPDGELKNKIVLLANQIKFPLKQILVIDGSKRSSHSNAYFYGFWKNKRIVLYDTLIKQMKTDEIVAVVCHELGHWKHNHIKWNFVLFSIKIFILFYIYQYFIYSEEIFIAFGFKEKSIFMGSVLFFGLFQPIYSILELINLVISRIFEIQADNFALQLNYGNQLKSGLTKLYSENVSNLLPDPWYAWYHYSHPSLYSRILNIKEFLKANPEKQNPQYVSGSSSDDELLEEEQEEFLDVMLPENQIPINNTQFLNQNVVNQTQLNNHVQLDNNNLFNIQQQQQQQQQQDLQNILLQSLQKNQNQNQNIQIIQQQEQLHQLLLQQNLPNQQNNINNIKQSQQNFHVLNQNQYLPNLNNYNTFGTFNNNSLINFDTLEPLNITAEKIKPQQYQAEQLQFQIQKMLENQNQDDSLSQDSYSSSSRNSSQYQFNKKNN